MKRSESGAAAVELALVLPLLVLLVFGIIEFSRAYNAQISLSAAAREGVRVMAVSQDRTAATAATIAAAPSLNPALTASNVTVTPTTCTTGGRVTLTVTYRMSYITGLFGRDLTLTGKGVMRCGG